MPPPTGLIHRRNSLLLFQPEGSYRGTGLERTVELCEKVNGKLELKPMIDARMVDAGITCCIVHMQYVIRRHQAGAQGSKSESHRERKNTHREKM